MSRDIQKLTRPPEVIVNALWVNPGMTMDELLDALGLPHWKGDIVQTMELVYAIDTLMEENRVRCIRFVSYAPFMETTHRFYPTEIGRIEIVDPDPQSKDYYLFVHDPFGKWDEKIDKYS